MQNGASKKIKTRDDFKRIIMRSSYPICQIWIPAPLDTTFATLLFYSVVCLFGCLLGTTDFEISYLLVASNKQTNNRCCCAGSCLETNCIICKKKDCCCCCCICCAMTYYTCNHMMSWWLLFRYYSATGNSQVTTPRILWEKHEIINIVCINNYNIQRNRFFRTHAFFNILWLLFVCFAVMIIIAFNSCKHTRYMKIGLLCIVIHCALIQYCVINNTMVCLSYCAVVHNSLDMALFVLLLLLRRVHRIHTRNDKTATFCCCLSLSLRMWTRSSHPQPQR